MALGGGYFTTMNKVLPGSYINFVSVARASANLSDRGVCAIALPLKWGADDTIITVEPSDMIKNTMKIFGYAYTADEMLPLRELFQYAQTAYIYKLGAGTKASGTYGTAVCGGSRGNDLKIVIEANTDSTYNVKTYMGTVLVDEQDVAAVTDLVDNSWVAFKTSTALSATTDTFTGGADASADDVTAAYATFLTKIEPYSYNILGCVSEDETIKKQFVAFEKDMRENVGVKFQVVLYNYPAADYEGVISVKNASNLIPWVTGLEAACAVNKSCTNMTYNGELTVSTDYTQSQLETAVNAGEFVFHKVGDDVRVLTDINTLHTFTEEKNKDFSKNQVIRVLDQIGNDIAALFNKKYVGKIQNDANGRISLWNDIVTHHNSLLTLRAIENFTSDDVTVEAVADDKTAVAVSDYVTPVCAMEKLYMTVYVQ